MSVAVFELSHLFQVNPKAIAAEGMTGITVLSDEGDPLACGGVIYAPWGVELWIQVRDDLSVIEAIKVARTAKHYVRIASMNEPVFAHVFAKDEERRARLLGWLGLEKETEIESEQGTCSRYRMVT